MIKKYTHDSDIKFLTKLATDNVKGGSTIVEIGTASLGTTVPLARSLPESKIITVDIYNSPKVTYKNYIHNFEVLKTLEIDNVVLVCSTSEFFGKIYKGNIDFLWIDGNHKREFAKKDIKIWGKKLKKGCIICGHDYTGHNGEVRSAVDEFVKSSSKYKDFGVHKGVIWYARRA